MAIITTAQFKTYKGVSGTTYDAQLDVIIPAAEAQVTTYTGRTFAAATLTEKYNGTDSPVLQLNNWPITSITSITMTTPSGSSIVPPSTAYAIDLANGLVKFDPPSFGGGGVPWWGNFPQNNGYPADVWQECPVFPAGHQNITVIYVVTSGITADLQLAMYQWVDYMLAGALQTAGSALFKHERSGLYDYERAATGANLDYFHQLFGPFRKLVA